MKKIVCVALLTVLLCSVPVCAKPTAGEPLSQQEYEAILVRLRIYAEIFKLMTKNFKRELETTLKISFKDNGGAEMLKRVFPTVTRKANEAFIRKYGFSLDGERPSGKSGKSSGGDVALSMEEVGSWGDFGRWVRGLFESAEAISENDIFVDLKMTWGHDMPDDVARQFANHLHAALMAENAAAMNAETLKEWQYEYETYKERADGHWFGPVDPRIFAPGWPFGWPPGPGDITRLRQSPHPWIFIWCSKPPATYIGGPPLPGRNPQNLPTYTEVVTVSAPDPCRAFK